jgi:hypothetical protein
VIEKYKKRNGVNQMTKIKTTIYDLDIQFERVTEFGRDELEDDCAEDVTVCGVPLEQYPAPFRVIIMEEVNGWIDDNPPDWIDEDGPEPEEVAGCER